MSFNEFTIKEMPTQERPREKMINHGPSALSNSELLAILIRTGSKEKSAIDLGNEVIKKIDGLTKIHDVTHEELLNINGIGNAKACVLLASIELNKRISSLALKKRVRITSPNDIINIFMDELRFEKRENFITVLLNTKNEVISKEIISIGNLNTSIVHPREVYKLAIKKSASSIIFIHNHPSGDSKPSKNDKNITNRLVKAGDIIGIDVIDHIILGNDEYFSFKENNLI